jgi:hypothetical protein
VGPRYRGRAGRSTVAASHDVAPPVDVRAEIASFEAQVLADLHEGQAFFHAWATVLIYPGRCHLEKLRGFPDVDQTLIVIGISSVGGVTSAKKVKGSHAYLAEPSSDTETNRLRHRVLGVVNGACAASSMPSRDADDDVS